MSGLTTPVTSPLEEPIENLMRSVRESVKEAIELKEPMSERELTTREKIILLAVSKLHGSRFPPWTSPPLSSDFEQPSGQPCFM